MPIKTAYSSKATAREVAAELSAGISESKPCLVIYFASARYDSAALSAELRSAFKEAVLIGCSTAGEIVSGRMLKHSVVAMGIGSDIIEDAAVEVVDSIRSENHVPRALAALERHFGARMADMDTTTHVGLILIDGMQGAEERLMEKIGDLTNVTFVGGSAGDDLAFKRTHVCANGKAFTNAAVVAVLKLKKGFDIIKTQSFRSTGKTLKANKVDEPNRIVLEFNNKPATTAYAEALGIGVADVSGCFMSHPVGLISADGQPYVRSPRLVKDGSMAFYCNIKEGMELSVLESTDIVSDTREAVREKAESLGSTAGMINFHCILRTVELEQKGQTEAYGQIFSSIPTVGFSTYGEQYIGHINQTATILVFK